MRRGQMSMRRGQRGRFPRGSGPVPPSPQHAGFPPQAGGFHPGTQGAGCGSAGGPSPVKQEQPLDSGFGTMPNMSASGDNVPLMPQFVRGQRARGRGPGRGRGRGTMTMGQQPTEGGGMLPQQLDISGICGSGQFPQQAGVSGIGEGGLFPQQGSVSGDGAGTNPDGEFISAQHTYICMYPECGQHFTLKQNLLAHQVFSVFILAFIFKRELL